MPFSAQLNVTTESASCFAARQTSDVQKKKKNLCWMSVHPHRSYQEKWISASELAPSLTDLQSRRELCPLYVTSTAPVCSCCAIKIWTLDLCGPLLTPGGQQRVFVILQWRVSPQRRPAINMFRRCKRLNSVWVWKVDVKMFSLHEEQLHLCQFQVLVWIES